MPLPASRPGSKSGLRKGKSRPASRMEHHLPTDILSDDYESDGDASERVISLLKNGVRARQSSDLRTARTEFAKASRVQQNRNKRRKKLDLWLLDLARLHGKDQVRGAARDIQRCYRGMLGREEASWERMDRRKRMAAAGQLQNSVTGNKQAQEARERAQREQALRNQARIRAAGVVGLAWRCYVARESARKVSACWQLQAAVRRRSAETSYRAQRAEAEEGDKEQVAPCVCLQRVWRGAMGRRLAREERTRRGEEVRGEDAARVISRWWMSVLRSRCAQAQTKERTEDLRRAKEEEEQRAAREESVRRESSSLLVAVIRRLWATWSMEFVRGQGGVVQRAWRCRQAREAYEAARARRMAEEEEEERVREERRRAEEAQRKSAEEADRKSVV